jgi:hypothetical protein
MQEHKRLGLQVQWRSWKDGDELEERKLPFCEPGPDVGARISSSADSDDLLTRFVRYGGSLRIRNPPVGVAGVVYIL